MNAETSPTKARGERTLAGRLTAHLVVSVAVVFALTSLTGTLLVARQERRSWERRTAEYARDLADGFVEPLEAGDLESLALACRAFSHADAVAWLRVSDAHGGVLFNHGERTGDNIGAAAPIQHGGKLLGRVELGVGRSSYWGSLLTSLELSAATAIAVIVALLASGLLIQRTLRRPLGQLVSLLDRLSFGRYPEEVPELHYREFSSIVRSFGRMAARVRFGEASLVDANALLREEIVRREEAVRAVVAAEKAARDSAALLQHLFDATPVGVALSVDRTLRRVNERFCEITGFDAGELAGMELRGLYGDEEEYLRVGEQLHMGEHAEGARAVETVWRRKDGAAIDVLLQWRALDPCDWTQGLSFTVTDITAQRLAATERDALHERLARSQRLEAIGTLAGGIAHDFNNILWRSSAIPSLPRRRPGDPLRGSAARTWQVVRQAGRRAAELSARSWPSAGHACRSSSRPASPHRDGGAQAPARLAPHDHRGAMRLDCDAVVMADPAQLHQVLVNLCTNAGSR